MADAFTVQVAEASEDLFEDVFVLIFVQNCVCCGNLVQQFHSFEERQDLVYFVLEVVTEQFNPTNYILMVQLLNDVEFTGVRLQHLLVIRADYLNRECFTLFYEVAAIFD